MNALSLACFISAVVSAVLATSLIARDPGLKLNRLVAMIPACVAHWGLMEALWSVQSDAETAAWLIRLSAFGWMSLGPLCFQAFVELAGRRAEAHRRFVPWVWTGAFLSMFIYFATPWCLGDVTRTSWGFAYEIGPLFPLVYASTGLPVAFVLANWSRVAPDEGAWGERRVSRAIFISVAIGLALASLTDGVLPALGRPVPQLSVPVLTGVMLVVAFQLRRFGFSVLSPAAFAEEILESLVDGVVLLRPDGRIRHANGAFARLAGCPEGSLRERPLQRFLPEMPAWIAEGTGPEARSGIETVLAPAAGGGVPVSISSCALQRDLGSTLGSAVVVRDLRHVASLRERLVTTGRLAAVGELSAGIAHEIQEPVARVRQELEVLRRRWGSLALALGRAGSPDRGEASAPGPAADPDEALAECLGEGEELVEECLEGVDRIESIVADVAGLAEQGHATREPVDMDAVLDRAVRIAVPRDCPGIVVERRRRTVPPVPAFAPQLEQVFTNLLRNAVHAVGETGRIRVDTELAGSRVRVRIEDDGPGIAPDVRGRIFDPFFTTKPVGEGTGLGLAISYHIVENHGGEIRVQSAPGEGARFVVELPVATERAAEAREVG